MSLIESTRSFTMKREDLANFSFTPVEIDPTVDNPIKNQLGQDVFGQPEAVDALASAVMRSEAGFTDPNRPKGVFFFLGPTGVGKTEMAKALTRHLYPDDWESHFLRVDCTDYTDSSSINRIKGSQNGYVGYGDPVLIMPDFLQKGGVIVFDEIEKGHRSLHSWLLPIMEEGTAKVPLPTDKPSANGSTNSKEIVPTELDFRNSYLIMTSNVGAEAINDAKNGKGAIGFGEKSAKQADTREAALKALKSHFASMPEFLGRIGETNSIVFKDLGFAEYDRILDKFLSQINANQTQNAILLSVTEELKKYLIEDALNGTYGARTLRDRIDRDIIGQAAEIKYTQRMNSGMLVADINDDTQKVFFWTPNWDSSSQGHEVNVFHEPNVVQLPALESTNSDENSE